MINDLYKSNKLGYLNSTCKLFVGNEVQLERLVCSYRKELMANWLYIMGWK